MADRHTAKARMRRGEALGLIIVGGIAIVLLLIRELLPRGLPDGREAVAALPLSDSAVAATLDHPIWSEIVGHGEGTLSAEARGIRLGASLVELEARSQLGDSAARFQLSAAAAEAERAAGRSVQLGA
jgi:hypothetical protein